MTWVQTRKITSVSELTGGRRGVAAPGCPRWCDGRRDADDRDAVFHGCYLERVGGVIIAFSLMQPRDPARAGGGPVILPPAPTMIRCRS